MKTKKMSKRGKTYRGKKNPYTKGGCNCFHCCGDPEKRYEVHHLQKIKNKRDWSEDEDQNLNESNSEKN